MTKREVIKCVLDGKKPPYVPWSFKFTKEPKEALMQYYDTDDLDPVLGNHILQLGSDIGFFEDLGGDYVRDVFGVVWDRSVDKDIGDVKGCILENPTLECKPCLRPDSGASSWLRRGSMWTTTPTSRVTWRSTSMEASTDGSDRD